MIILHTFLIPAYCAALYDVPRCACLHLLTLLTFILVKILYDIGTGQDVWQAARVFWVFPPQLDHLLEINHPHLNLSGNIIIFALKIAV